MPAMTEVLETQAGRIRARMAEIDITQDALANAVGVSQGTINHILNGRTLKSKHLPKIAEALAVNLSWLTLATDKMLDLRTPDGRALTEAQMIERLQLPPKGDGFARLINTTAHIYMPEPARLDPPPVPAPDNTVHLPQLEIGYSMGGGSVFSDYQQVADIPFPRDWVAALAKGSFSDLFVARGEGDSMSPTLLDNDSVIIDTAQKSITQQDRIWCLSYGDLGMIKRVRVQPDGGILVMSDNPAVSDFTAYDGEVHVVGRVVWIGRKV